MQKEATYIGQRQGKFEQWVSIRTIFEVFAWAAEDNMSEKRDTGGGYKGHAGGGLVGGAAQVNMIGP